MVSCRRLPPRLKRRIFPPAGKPALPPMRAISRRRFLVNFLPRAETAHSGEFGVFHKDMVRAFVENLQESY